MTKRENENSLRNKLKKQTTFSYQWLRTGDELFEKVGPTYFLNLQTFDNYPIKNEVFRTPEIFRIGVGDDTGLVPIYVLSDEDVHALAGERSRAECVTDETEAPHVAVPSRCIVSIGLRPTVFIRDAHDAERFIAVPVTPGASGGGWTAVEGLPSGHCEVVTDGAYELKLALPSAADSKPAGHFHADGTFHEGGH